MRASADVAEGDLLFFYTDGCVEAESEAGEMFGAERLEAVLRSAAAPGAGDALAVVETAVSQFRGYSRALRRCHDDGGEGGIERIQLMIWNLRLR